MNAPIIALTLATVVPSSKKPVHHEGVDDKNQPSQDLPQPNSRMLMIVPAPALMTVLVIMMMIMFVLVRLKSEVTCIRLC